MDPLTPEDVAELAYDDDPSADLRAEELPDHGAPETLDDIPFNEESPF